MRIYDEKSYYYMHPSMHPSHSLNMCTNKTNDDCNLQNDKYNNHKKCMENGNEKKKSLQS
jgi:hypothetical protein